MKIIQGQMNASFLILILVICRISNGDVYMHNARGSNNRLNEPRRNVQNNKRLFNSQNNNRGGYNQGHLYYLVGSRLQIEWTAQHSCADQNNNCDIILQYMCSNKLRDGASTETIPESNTQCEDNNCDTDIRYGMHENNTYYLRCRARERNRGLFTASQVLRGNSAIYTRQNPGGTRYGYECPEERDYYPYWYPTPWKDIAILTNNAKKCKYFQQESGNVKTRYECRVPIKQLQDLVLKNRVLPTTQTACESPTLNGTWTKVPSHGIAPPECREPDWTRDNHLGNTKSGYSPLFNWTIPSGESENDLCTLRIRYNISTNDYNGWDTFASGPKTGDFGRKFGFASNTVASQRGYKLENNPKVQMFDDAVGKKLKLQLAVNTAQYGRTFEDRSHGFSIKKSPVKGVVHNVNVRGKRGNIVQVYPSVEYDFTPNTLQSTPGDYIHFQWTGSNNNDPNNDGQGQAGTDRSNVLLQADAAYPQTAPAYSIPSYGRWGRSYPFKFSSSNTLFLNLSKSDIENLAFSGTLFGDVQELDDARTYFDLGPRKVTMSGVSHYMCTRNNNFSNRSQKGRIICTDQKVFYHNVGSNGGTFSTADRSVIIQVNPNVFQSLASIQIEEWDKTNGEKRLREKNVKPPSGDGYASNFFKIGFSEKPRSPVKVSLKTTIKSDRISVYRGNADSLGPWERLEITKEKDGYVSFKTDKSGVFVSRYHNESNLPLIIGLTVGSVVIVAAIGLLIYLERSRQFCSKCFSNCSSKV